MNTLEQFHIHKLSKENMHVDDTYTDTHNPVFNFITKYCKEYHINTKSTPPTNSTVPQPTPPTPKYTHNDI
jgi:hypothetical protein